MEHAIIEKLKKEIEKFGHEAKLENSGVVVSAADGVADVEGLRDAVMSEMVLFETTSKKKLEDALGAEDLFGVVLNLEEDLVKVIVLGDSSRVTEGMRVSGTGKVLSLPVGEAFLGRVVSALGEPLDGKGDIKAHAQSPIQR